MNFLLIFNFLHQTLRIPNLLELQPRPDLLVVKSVILLAVGVPLALLTLEELALIAKTIQVSQPEPTPLPLKTQENWTLASAVMMLASHNAQKSL